MNKKILVLSSSPRRRGNSDSLCEQFVLGAKEMGHDVEKIFLQNQTINYCNGCGICYNKQGKCSQNDDMTEISKKMIWVGY